MQMQTQDGHYFVRSNSKKQLFINSGKTNSRLFIIFFFSKWYSPVLPPSPSRNSQETELKSKNRSIPTLNNLCSEN